MEKPKDDGIDRGEIRTVFSRSIADIKSSGVSQCKNHKWRKLNDNELECVNCPTVIVVGIDNIEKYL
jgi:hypothetical protein